MGDRKLLPGGSFPISCAMIKNNTNAKIAASQIRAEMRMMFAVLLWLVMVPRLICQEFKIKIVKCSQHDKLQNTSRIVKLDKYEKLNLRRICENGSFCSGNPACPIAEHMDCVQVTL